MLPVGGDLRKLNMGAQQQTFPYLTVSKLFLHSNAQTLLFKSVMDKQTNRQKTQHFWSLWRWVKSEPHQTQHSNREPWACYCTSTCKMFGVWCIVSLLGAVKICGKPDLIKLKLPIRPNPSKFWQLELTQPENAYKCSKFCKNCTRIHPCRRLFSVLGVLQAVVYPPFHEPNFTTIGAMCRRCQAQNLKLPFE